jgi:hypothetical protein
MSANISLPLSHMDTEADRKERVRQALLRGRTLTDPGLWIGGIRDPQKLIARLRKDGMQIETTYVRTVDAAGDEDAAIEMVREMVDIEDDSIVWHGDNMDVGQQGVHACEAVS